MARTISEIYNALVAEKDSMSSLQALQPNADNSQQLLQDVTSTSKVADWRLWLWIVAFAQFLLESIWDAFRVEIDAKVATAKSHNLKWYQLQALKFQYGHNLVFNDDLEKFEYASADVDSLIIKRAAVSEDQGTVIVKVAKADAPLTNDEKAAFVAYMNEIKDAGTDILVISTTADEFKLTAEVYYDPLVLNPDGSLILDSSRFPIFEQAKAYVVNLDFDGALNRTALIDSLQLGEGILDPVLSDLQVKTNIDAYQAIPVEHETYAGYYELDENALTINYIPKV